MSVNIPPPERAAGVEPAVPAFVRADGGVRVAFATAGKGTQAITVAESGGYRVRFPRCQGPCEAVLINTGGGMAGGDRMAVAIATGPGAEAVVTSQAAEKLYRSQGPAAEIDVSLELGPGSRLDWIPQETILFDGARLKRRLRVTMAGDARLTLCESVFFGRLAMGETVTRGALLDRWRIRRDGRLVFAEDVRLDGPVADILARRAVGRAARALATVLHIASDAEARLEEMRAALTDASVDCAASAWNGLLLIRFLADEPQALRADLVRFLEQLRGQPMPRSW